jgi:hypothetical protein
VLACAANDKPVSHCALFLRLTSYGSRVGTGTRF